MLLGFQLRPGHVIAVGVVLFALLAFELLLGLRVIKLEGRTHWKVHRAVAWVFLAIAIVHGVMTALLFEYIRL